MQPPRIFDRFACLEVLEHLRDPGRLVKALQDTDGGPLRAGIRSA
ncbi:hypothetical protein ABZU75_28790 [Streptosporangium sp. NPDC005286]